MNDDLSPLRRSNSRMRSAIFSLLVTVLCLPIQAATLADAVKALQQPGLETRQAAEMTLKAGGAEALPLLTPLMFCGDPELEAKARNLRRWIRLGLNQQLPEEWCQKALNFNRLSAGLKTDLIVELMQCESAKALTMAHLHSRILELPLDESAGSDGSNEIGGRRQAEGQRQPPKVDPDQQLRKYSKDCLEKLLKKEKVSIGQLSPSLLHPQVRVMLLNQCAKNKVAELSKIYQKWLQLDMSIRAELQGEAVKLEIDRLVRLGDRGLALEWLSELKDEQARKQVLRWLKPWLREEADPSFKPLSLAQALGYLEVLASGSAWKESCPEYPPLRRKHPGLAKVLPDRLKAFEVFYQLDQGAFYEAFDLALSALMNSPYRSAMMQELGDWAGSHPEALTKGLPALPELKKLFPKGGGSRPYLRIALVDFAMALAPTAKTLSLEQIEIKVRQFNQLELKSARPGLWLSLLENPRGCLLYYYTMAIRGELDAALTEHEKKQSSQLRGIGYLLAMKPGFSNQIRAGSHQSHELQSILAAYAKSRAEDYSLISDAYQLAEQWEKHCPNLFEDNEDSIFFAMLVYRAWHKKTQAEAIIMIDESDLRDYQKGNLLMSLLDADPELDLGSVLSHRSTPLSMLTPLIQRKVSRLVKLAESHTEAWRAGSEAGQKFDPQACRQLLMFCRIYQSHPGVKSTEVLSVYKAQQLAFPLWLAGHDALAYEIMQQGYWLNADRDNWRMTIFPELAVLTGRIDAALAYAGKVPGSCPGRSHKQAYLLRAAGKGEEALRLIDQSPASSLYRQLSYECLDEEGMQKALAKSEFSPEEKSVLQCWYALLKSDYMTAKKAYHRGAQKQGWLQLAVGDDMAYMRGLWRPSSFISTHTSRQLSAMGRESYLMSQCEELLLSALNTEEPVPCQTLKTYSRYLQASPDQKRVAMLVYELAQLPECDPGYANAPLANRWAHKAVAVKALSHIGRRDLMKKLLATMFARQKQWPEMDQQDKSSILAGAMVSGHPCPEALLKIMGWQYPDASLAERLSHLSDLFADGGRLPVVRRLADLTRRYQQRLSRDEQLEMAALVMSLLGERDKAGLKQAEDALLPKLESLISQAEAKILAGDLSQQISRSSFHRPRSLDRGGRSLHPAPGHCSDPRASDFVMVDGLHMARKFWDQNQQARARALVCQTGLRMLYDESLRKRSIWLQIKTSRMSSRAPYIPHVAALICFTIWQMDAELVGELADSCARIGTDHAAYDRHLWASEWTESQGDYGKALTYYRAYLFRHRRAGLGQDTPVRLAHWYDLEALQDLAEGEIENVQPKIRKRMQWDPYNMDFILRILEGLKEQNKMGEIEQINQWMVRFWQRKLLQLPDYEPYVKALQQWRRAVASLRKVP